MVRWVGVVGHAAQGGAREGCEAVSPSFEPGSVFDDLGLASVHQRVGHQHALAGAGVRNGHVDAERRHTVAGVESRTIERGGVLNGDGEI